MILGCGQGLASRVEDARPGRTEGGRLAWVCSASLLLSLAVATPSDASDERRLKLSDSSAVPGQVVVVSGSGVTPKSKVRLGSKRARVVSRAHRKLAVEVPKLKPGRVSVAVHSHGLRLTAHLQIKRGFTGKVRPTLDSAAAASAEIGPTGGTISATGSDGAAYELAIPAGALVAPTTITLTPVSKLGGAPGGSNAVAAQFGPDGLALARSATLRITPPKLRAHQAGLAYTGSGSGLELSPVSREGGSLLVEVRHFSGAGATSITERDFERLVAQLAASPLTLEASGHFFRDYRAVPEEWCNPQHATCFSLLVDIEQFLGTLNIADCNDAARGSFIDLHINVLAVLFGLEGDAAARGRSFPKVMRCRQIITQAMFDLTREPARTDALQASSPCSGVRLAQADYDASGTIVNVECLLLVAAEADLQGFGAIAVSAQSVAEEGMRKVLADAKVKCDAKDYAGGQALLEPGLKIAAAVQILSQEFAEALLDCQPKINVVPSAPSVEIDHAQVFGVTVEDPTDQAVDWSASGGTINVGTGAFVAPHAPGPATVTATSRAHPDRHGTTVVNVTCPAGQVADQGQCKTVTISISPTSASVAPGAQQQFTGGVTGTSDTRVTWSATCGSVTPAGLYTAPQTPGTCTVKVASVPFPTLQATAVVTVTSDAVVSVDGRDADVNTCGADIRTRPLDLPYDGVWTETAGTCPGAAASATQTSNVEASADGSGWLDFDGSASATNTSGPVAFAISEQTVSFAAADQGATLSCSGPFTSSGSGVLIIWLDGGSQQLLTSTSSQQVMVSTALPPNSSHELWIRTSSIANEIGSVSSSAHITCDFDGPVEITPND